MMPHKLSSKKFLPNLVPVANHQWEQGMMPVVSITCITFNHEKFIREAIEGFLKQETTFSVEIVIHDDASTDATAKIIREYETKYSGKIFPIYQTENQYSKGMDMILNNLFSHVRGKYVAFCEGDDYWTDPLKLQKQVDFLEANPEYSGTSHQSLVIHTDGPNKEPRLFRNHDFTDIEIDHLLDGRLFHTASLVFRSEIVKKHSLPVGITAGDRALFFLVATCGKIYFSNEVMCCYRKHAGGMSSWVTTEMLEKDLKIIPWISKINPKFPKHRYAKFLHFVVLSYPPYLSVVKLIKHSILYVYHSLHGETNKFRDIKTFITHHFPLFIAKTKSDTRQRRMYK